MSTTLREIAAKAGVSIGTVSLALRDDPRVANGTKERIRGIAQEADYVPSGLGRGLQSGRSFLIGYMVADMGNSFYNEILQGIGKVATSRGCGLLVAVTEGSHASEVEQLALFKGKRVDGIIVSNYHPDTVPELLRLADSGLPMVVADYVPLRQGIPTIILDDAKACAMLAGHLTGLGHESFAYYPGETVHSDTRYAGFSKALTELGHEPPIIIGDEAHLIGVFSEPPHPTALVCYSDLLAAKAIMALTPRGLSIPGDLSVTGFDDMFFSPWPGISLTTIAQPKTGIGAEAAKILMDLMEGRTYSGTSLLEPVLVVRNSTGKYHGKWKEHAE